MEQKAPSAPPAPIGTYEGWDLTFDLAKKVFIATKGRKVRTNTYIDHLYQDCRDADHTAERAKRTIVPCSFVRWDPVEQKEQRVTLTSFSNKGVALKPPEGPTEFLERNPWRNSEGTTILVLRKGQTTKRLHTAVKMLRQAQSELRSAEDAALAQIKVNDPGYGKGVEAFHVEEDRLRDVINNAGGLDS